MVSIYDLQGRSVFDVKGLGINFGAAVTGGAFISRNSYYGQEFNRVLLNSNGSIATTTLTNKGGYYDARGDTAVNAIAACTGALCGLGQLGGDLAVVSSSTGASACV